MKLSDYTITVEDYPKEGEHILFNTRTQAMVKIKQELKEILSAKQLDMLKELHKSMEQDMEKCHSGKMGMKKDKSKKN